MASEPRVQAASQVTETAGEALASHHFSDGLGTCIDVTVVCGRHGGNGDATRMRAVDLQAEEMVRRSVRSICDGDVCGGAAAAAGGGRLPAVFHPGPRVCR